jgi:hypothetical protein
MNLLQLKLSLIKIFFRYEQFLTTAIVLFTVGVLLTLLGVLLLAIVCRKASQSRQTQEHPMQDLKAAPLLTTHQKRQLEFALLRKN